MLGWYWLRRGAPAAALPAILVAAFVVRAWGVQSGVPHAVGIDEPAIIDRALRILNTGDWNPHIFDYPTLVIYVHAIAMVALFLGGAIAGAWSSLATFDVGAIYMSARVITALIGSVTVWLTYRVAEGIGGRALGLLAAAQLAVLPIHVRESHFALTDVPVTALTTLAVWLAMRAAARRTTNTFMWAGVACGLAAAAKYNGVVACAALLATWLAGARSDPQRWRHAMIACGSAAGAFLVAAPYVLLDFPAFLSGFAAQAARFSGPHPGEPSWVLYLKHMALMGRFWLPAAGIGAVLLVWRRETRALPLFAFGAAYFYTLATHGLVFARYALPLLPVVCVLAAVPVLEAFRLLERAGRARFATWTMVAGTAALTIAFTVQSIDWLRHFANPDTRQIVAGWMKENVSAGARMMVENSGPTYLSSLKFDVVPVELATDHPLEWYREQRVKFLVISSRELSLVRDYVKAGPVVFEVAPSDTRWGPPIRVVQLH